MLKAIDDAEEQEAHDAEDEDARVHLQVVDAQPGIHDVVAHAILRAERLREEQHRDGRRHRDADGRDELRQGGRQDDETEDLAKRGAERVEWIIALLRQRANGVAHRHDDLEDDDQEDHEDFRELADTGEQHEDWQQGNLRDGVRQVDDGRQEAVGPAEVAHDDAEWIADADSQAEACCNAPEAVGRVLEDVAREDICQAHEHLIGRRHDGQLEQQREPPPDCEQEDSCSKV